MSTDNTRHQKKMQHRKEVMDKKIASAQEERGVLLVHTGNGKGKSSAAFGMVARALGHGMRVGVVQLLKARKARAKRHFFAASPKWTTT